MRIILIMFTIISCLLLVSCSNHTDANSIVLSKEEVCKENWAICKLLGSGEVEFEEKTEVKVAVLDSGINENVKALEGKVEKSYNTFDNTEQTEPTFEHGTMIASQIAGDNSGDITVGLNQNATLYDVQVLDEYGNGDVQHVIKGIKWSIKNEVDIINLSFGFSNDSPELEEVIKEASAKDIIVVAAAGNTIKQSTDYPAKYSDVISISAVDEQNKAFAYGAKGKIDFVAPGVNVPVLNKDGKIVMQSGTSFSTAYATGIISLIIQKGEKDIRNQLYENAQKIGSAEEYGTGLIKIK